MPRISAGLLMDRLHDGKLQVLLAHPGGPYFKNKDDGAWSIPKGEVGCSEHRAPETYEWYLRMRFPGLAPILLVELL
jgi:predicted NUDIX family NTP pyrophosphohydrolase